MRLISDMKSRTKKELYSAKVLEVLSDMSRQRTVHTQRIDLEPSHIALLKYDANPSEWPNLLDIIRLMHHRQGFFIETSSGESIKLGSVRLQTGKCTRFRWLFKAPLRTRTRSHFHAVSIK